MPGGPPPKKPKVTDEELLRAVAHVCNTSPEPVAKSEEVADVDFIDVKQQTVKRRLDTLGENGRVGSMKVGRGKVWWPVDGESDPKYDEEGIYWDGIDPAEIPPEMVEEHPEFPFWDRIETEEVPDGMVEKHPQYPNPDQGEKIRKNGEIIFSTSVIITVIGLVLALPRMFNLSYIPIPREVETFGAIAVLGGFVFIAAGVGFMIFGHLLSKAEAESYISYLGN